MSKKEEVLVLRLLDRKKSNWIMEGSAEAGTPIALEAPDGRRILSNSAYEKDGIRVPIRYIEGIDEIHKSEQEKQGIKPNLVMDKIWFEPGGVLRVPNKGRTKGLYEYLRKCEWNKDNPLRPDSAEPIFEEVKAEMSAQNIVDDDMLLAEAMSLVQELGKKNSDSTWSYDKERVEYMATLFNVSGLETTAEKVAAIASVAKAQPAYFLEVVTTKTATIRAEVKKAIHLKVISLAADKASFIESKHAFYEFTAKAKETEKRIDEVVQHMLSNAGNQDYADMLSLTEKAADKQLALQD
jgi:hypothetical protein